MVKPPGFSKVQFTTEHYISILLFSGPPLVIGEMRLEGCVCVRERRRSVSLERWSKNKRNWGGLR